MEIKSLWHISKQKSEIRKSRLDVEEGKIYVRALYSMISTGTERKIASGHVPEEIYHAMAVPFMQGNYPFPVTHGYSLVGRVEEGPGDLPGKLVHLMHPHQNYVALNDEAFFLIPASIDPAIATLGSNMETVINAIWDSKISFGDRVLITGFGTIGALLAITLKIAMPFVTFAILETNAKRRQTGIALGLPMVTHPDELETGFDVAFDSSGNENALQVCIDKTGYGGRIVALSWFGNQSTNLNLGGDFHTLRKSIISSQVSHIPMHKKEQWDYRRRKALVFDVLKHDFWKKVPFSFIPFNETPAFFKQLRENNTEEIFNIIKYT